MLESIIILSIVAALVVGAIAKTIADKKKGVKCTGCPHSKTCTSKDLCR